MSASRLSPFSLLNSAFRLTIRASLAIGLCLFAGLGCIATAAESFDLDSEIRSESLFPKMREVEQDGLKPHVDVMIGQAVPEGRFRPGSELGFGFGFQPYVPFGLGLMINHTVATPNGSGIRNIDRTAALLRGTYHFAGETPLVKYSHIGLAAGPVINQDAMYFGLTPIIGFDVPVQEWIGEYYSYVTLGAEARYLFVSAPESDQLTLTAAAKYWF